MRDLLFSVTKNDFEIKYFSGTGAGGQHRNKHQNCVRLFHSASGVRSTGQSSRSRISNLKEAFRTIIKDNEFKMWMHHRTMAALGNDFITKSVDKVSNKSYINKSVAPEFIKVEEKVNGRWKEMNI